MDYEQDLDNLSKKFEELLATTNVSELQNMVDELKKTISRQMFKFTELHNAATIAGDEVPYPEQKDLYSKYNALADKISDARDEVGCGLYVYSYSQDGIIPWAESYC